MSAEQASEIKRLRALLLACRNGMSSWADDDDYGVHDFAADAFNAASRELGLPECSEDGEILDEDDEDDEPDEAERPVAGAWPGNIRLRDPVATAPARDSAMDDVFKLHAMGEAIGRAKGDPALQIAYAAAFGRLKAFSDLLEALLTIPPPYTRGQIVNLVGSLGDPPWEIKAQDPPAPGPEDVAVLAGQWKCTACSWRNNDLRRRCRNCDRPRHTRGAT